MPKKKPVTGLPLEHEHTFSKGVQAAIQHLQNQPDDIAIWYLSIILKET
jgi:hypothetical protein